MHVYKFRIVNDLNEDFLREVDIKASQTFRDLHEALLECIELNGEELASFFVCDQDWNKQREITLLDMVGERSADEEKPLGEPLIMSETRLKDVVEEPRQRLLYEYDFLNINTFYVELVKIDKIKKGQKYPVCARKKGKYVRPDEPVPEELDGKLLSEQLLKDFNDLLHQTYDYEGDDSV